MIDSWNVSAVTKAARRPALQFTTLPLTLSLLQAPLPLEVLVLKDRRMVVRTQTLTGKTIEFEIDGFLSFRSWILTVFFLNSHLQCWHFRNLAHPPRLLLPVGRPSRRPDLS